MYKNYLIFIKKKKLIKSGVLQGSVFGPLRFQICINDRADSISSVYNLYADSTSLILSSPNMYLSEPVASHDLEKLNRWSKSRCRSYYMPSF